MVHTMPQGPFDDPCYAYHNVGSHNGDQKEKEGLNKVKEKCQILEKMVRAMEGNNIFGVVAMGICLVSYLIIPTKFNTPNFDKYKGYTCMRNHLVMYFRKMVAHTKNDKLLFHCI